MNIGDFKDLAEGIQAVVLSLAVIVGGVWAAFRFWSLRELSKSRAELEKLTKSLTERGTLTLQMKAQPIPQPEGAGYFIDVKVSVTNVGNRPEVLDWQKGKLEVATVIPEEDGQIVLQNWLETALNARLMQVCSEIAPSQTIEFPFLVPVTDPGMYYVGLRVPASVQEAEVQKKLVGDLVKPGDLVRWNADTYVLVH